MMQRLMAKIETELVDCGGAAYIWVASETKSVKPRGGRGLVADERSITAHGLLFVHRLGFSCALRCVMGGDMGEEIEHASTLR